MTNNNSIKKNRAVQRIRCFALKFSLFFAVLSLICGIAPAHGQSAPYAKYIILMIADGWGQTKIDAANMYTGSVPFYQTDSLWKKHWMTTYPYGCDYNTAQAWGNFSYVLNCATASGAAATAFYSGIKTQNSRISVSYDGVDRVFTIGEMAKTFGAGVGAITTVALTDATPGAMVAHNDSRANYYAIADEGFFGDPNTTGPPSDLYHSGGHGPTLPVVDVLIGDGSDSYVSAVARGKLRAEKGSLGDPGRDTSKHYLVERQPGQDAGAALMQAAGDPYVTKLAGLFDQVYSKADGSGYDTENPTLSESTMAALKVLGKNPNGFVLMIEGGAVDWAGHANDMDYAVGEMIDFNEAVQTVIDWVNNTSNGSNWNNTLLIVTGDHETGYLTAGPGRFPNQPIGPVNSQTLALEKIYSGSGGRRASWNDSNGNKTIDSGETVYWAWNTGGHANVLIPLYTSGVGSGLFENCIVGSDQVRGNFIDNTNVAMVMESAMTGVTSKGSLSIIPGQSLQGNQIDLTAIVQTSNAANINYQVTGTGSSCNVNPGGTYIEAENFTGTLSQGTGTFVLRTNRAGYLGTSYLQTNGGSSTASCPSADEGKGYNVYFPTAGTYTVWIRGYATSKNDDSLFIGIDGTCVGALRETPPGCTDGAGGTCELYLNKWVWTNIVQNGSNSVTVSTPGFHTINVWVREPDHRLDGIYITQGTTTPTDASHGITIDPMNCNTILFSGNQIQAQSANTTGWIIGVKNIKVSGSDVTCLTPLDDVYGTFNFVSCIETGSLSIMQGQILSGSPLDLTPIVSANHATNVLYTVTGDPGCPSKVNESIITKRDTWKYSIENTGTTWMNAGYNDSGWSTGSGVFGTAPDAASYGYSITTPISNTKKSMMFRKTFTVCNSSEVTALNLNALFDDGMVVYINGTQVYSQGVSGTPPAYNGSAESHEAVGYEAKSLSSVIGLNALRNLLVPGNNVIAVGVYNIIYLPPPDPPYISSDIVWDGELVLSNNGSFTTLFNGNAAAAQSVNTTDWTEGTKNIQVSGNDASCLSPLTGATGAFTFKKRVNYYCDRDGDSYISAAISGGCTGVGCAPSGCQTNAGTDCNDSNSQINPGASETCNNVDDNCNGITDENLSRQTTCGLGICSGNAGIEICSAGVWGNNTCNPYAGAMTEGPPGAQTCMDNLDNDCDGAADFTDMDCHVAFESNCFDGIDDDADGMVDCADPDCAEMKDGSCVTGQPGICSAGTLTCQAGSTVCVAFYGPQTEVCDGLDNNCDGAIDENLSRPTTCGLGICSGNTGIETCNGRVWGNNTCNPYAGAQMEGPPGDLSCIDNLDNDCDGITDFADGGCHVDHETNCYNGIDDDADGMTDCDDADCAGGPPVRIAGTLPEYFMNIQAAYSSQASIKVLQTKGEVLQEDLLFDINTTVTFEAGYDCAFFNINGKTIVNGNMTIGGGVVTISKGTLELK